MAQNLNYDYDIQKIYLEMMMADPEIFVRCQSIFDPDLFDRRLKVPARFLYDYAAEHSILPTQQIINAATNSNLIIPENLDSRHFDWLLQEFETFTKHKSLEKAILESSDLLENGEYGAVEEKIKRAVQIALTKDLGLDLFEDPKSHLEKLKNNKGLIPTGYKKLDYYLFGGLNIGDLAIFAAPSGGGKSVMLSNLGINWALMGLNVIYITAELSQDLVAKRLYSMLSDISTRDIFKNIEDIHLKLKLISKKAGKFQVKYMPAGKNANDIRAYVKEYEIKNKAKVNVALIDYLDLLYPINKRIPIDNLNLKDKHVSEELRNLAEEQQFVAATASQFNRSAVDEIEYGHNHIAGGISKIQTSDLACGIYFPKQMRDRGKIELQLLKTRNSSGVGNKIPLSINIDTLRITDCDDDDDSDDYVVTSTASSILKDIKNRKINEETNVPTKNVQANIQSSKLRDLLNQHANS